MTRAFDIQKKSPEAQPLVEDAPLAHRMRPQSLGDMVGQRDLLGEGGRLHALLAAPRLPSLMLWGPPGSGKTTLSRLIAEEKGLPFHEISATLASVSDLRKIFAEARARRNGAQSDDKGDDRDNDRGDDRGEGRQATLLFIDEIHRFNRAQQDAFLPYVEDGAVILIGATTENPSFYVTSALMSRLILLRLSRLEAEDLEILLTRVEGRIGVMELDSEARMELLHMADGDGRALFNMIEELNADRDRPDFQPIRTSRQLRRRLERRAPLHDRDRDGHYDLISALHKSVRASDVDAALYYFSRMSLGGEDPLYIARRLIRMAVEDIGTADPQALVQAREAMEAYRFLGSPEGELALVQAVIFLASAPKSNAVYLASKAAMKTARDHGSLPPPLHILNAPTRLMSSLGYGKGYRYDHDEPDAFSGRNCFPDALPRRRFYEPVERGFEREIRKRLAWWEKRRRDGGEP